MCEVNFTSIMIGSGIENRDDATRLILDWMRVHGEELKGLDCETKGIQVNTFIHPRTAYDGFCFHSPVISIAHELGCTLENMSYALITNEHPYGDTNQD